MSPFLTPVSVSSTVLRSWTLNGQVFPLVPLKAPNCRPKEKRGVGGKGKGRRPGGGALGIGRKTT